MRKYEFKVIPVPAICDKTAKEHGGDPVAATLETALNALAVEGWEFYRTETIAMPRKGVLGGRSVERELLVFRRDRPVMAQRPAELRDRMEARGPAEAEMPAALPAPDTSEKPAEDAPRTSVRPTRRARPVLQVGAA